MWAGLSLVLGVGFVENSEWGFNQSIVLSER